MVSEAAKEKSCLGTNRMGLVTDELQLLGWVGGGGLGATAPGAGGLGGGRGHSSGGWGSPWLAGVLFSALSPPWGGTQRGRLWGRLKRSARAARTQCNYLGVLPY